MSNDDDCVILIWKLLSVIFIYILILYYIIKVSIISQFYFGFYLLSVTHFAMKIINKIKQPPPNDKNAIPKNKSLFPT